MAVVQVAETKKAGPFTDPASSSRYHYEEKRIAPLLMAIVARFEIVLVMAGGVAPLDLRLGLRRSLCCLGRHRMGLVAVGALRNRLRFPGCMRHVHVGVYLLSTRRHVAGSLSGKLVKGSVARKASVFGDFRAGRCSRLRQGRHKTGVRESGEGRYGET